MDESKFLDMIEKDIKIYLNQFPLGVDRKLLRSKILIVVDNVLKTHKYKDFIR